MKPDVIAPGVEILAAFPPKLLRPDDKLVLGQAYRLVTSTDVEAMQARRETNMHVVTSESDGKNCLLENRRGGARQSSHNHLSKLQ
ncbi:hypothetical protein HanHA300_Chr11g0413931 [Helianthus annuus]|nr:hypothetical protein HanHA300_Chr11g0413931 [Helianthus annuus]KAJ0510619.1 hypothetical protein HanIR_Chr11g0542861 [Helianthus annuus]